MIRECQSERGAQLHAYSAVRLLRLLRLQNPAFSSSVTTSHGHRLVIHQLQVVLLMSFPTETCFVDPIIRPSSPSTTSAPDAQNSTATIATTTTTSFSSSTSQHNPSPSPTTWGLTISGFYYIALHRQSGRIEGLYYDPGSQPFQSLRMVVEGTALEDVAGTGVAGKGEERFTNEEIKAAHVPVKRWFPSLEFR
jgi:hypothetical protein